MTKALSLLTIIIFTITACSKNDTRATPDPVASFNLITAYSNNDTSQAITMAVYDGFILTNTSANADSYLWDFGNGNTSADKNPDSWYTKSGTYTLTLTASTKDGRKSIVSRTIKVLDRIAKQIAVTSLNPKSALGWGATYPTADKVNVWVEILQAAPNHQYPLSNFHVPDAPLLYKTTVATNVDPSRMPVSFDISDKLIIDIPTFNGGLYIFNLYARDNTGTYLVTSSYGSGIGFSTSGDIRYNRFDITTGFEGSNLSLKGEYE